MEIAKYVLMLFFLVLKEVISYKRDKKGEKLEIEQFLKLVENAKVRLREMTRKENTQIGPIEDQIDAERRRAKEQDGQGRTGNE